MNNQNLKRNEFLKELGFKGAALFALYCSGVSCTLSDVAPAQSASLTLDLTAPANENLLINGGFLVRDGIVIANVSGSYVAATQICSHDKLRKVIFKNGEFYCTEHGARFDLNGSGLNKDGKKGLQIFNVMLKDNLLSIS